MRRTMTLALASMLALVPMTAFAQAGGAGGAAGAGAGAAGSAASGAAGMGAGAATGAANSGIGAGSSAVNAGSTAAQSGMNTPGHINSSMNNSMNGSARVGSATPSTPAPPSGMKPNLQQWPQAPNSMSAPGARGGGPQTTTPPSTSDGVFNQNPVNNSYNSPATRAPGYNTPGSSIAPSAIDRTR